MVWKTMIGGIGTSPLYGLYRYVQPQRVGFFSLQVVINRVSVLVTLVVDTCKLELGMFL